MTEIIIIGKFNDATSRVLLDVHLIVRGVVVPVDRLSSNVVDEKCARSHTHHQLCFENLTVCKLVTEFKFHLEIIVGFL